MTEFVSFPKIARFSREIIVTEKIDGTNAQVRIVEVDKKPEKAIYYKNGLAILAGSRTRWITPDDDNYGFAAWVEKNAEQLFVLGVGSHFGEWWGQGIQRKYGISEKRFSLFNVSRWTNKGEPLSEKQEYAPECCHIVPVLYQGVMDSYRIDGVLTHLGATGSKAAPGFMNPEGIIIYHTASQTLFKKTLAKDDVPKSV